MNGASQVTSMMAATQHQGGNQGVYSNVDVYSEIQNSNMGGIQEESMVDEDNYQQIPSEMDVGNQKLKGILRPKGILRNNSNVNEHIYGNLPNNGTVEQLQEQMEAEAYYADMAQFQQNQHHEQQSQQNQQIHHNQKNQQNQQQHFNQNNQNQDYNQEFAQQAPHDYNDPDGYYPEHEMGAPIYGNAESIMQQDYQMSLAQQQEHHNQQDHQNQEIVEEMNDHDRLQDNFDMARMLQEQAHQNKQENPNQPDKPVQPVEVKNEGEDGNNDSSEKPKIERKLSMMRSKNVSF